jgi:murein L,D-transpeptidase YafK
MLRLFSLFLILLVPLHGMAVDAPVAKILVHKAKHRMELLDEHGRLVRRYRISLGGQPIGHKTEMGDEKTPEGHYVISGRNPHSNYHLSLRISYPNMEDMVQAYGRGVLPGGDIMIHGLPNGLGWFGTEHRRYNWTDGCIAVTDEEMEEIWHLVPDYTPIEIRP